MTHTIHHTSLVLHDTETAVYRSMQTEPLIRDHLDRIKALVEQLETVFYAGQGAEARQVSVDLVAMVVRLVVERVEV